MTFKTLVATVATTTMLMMAPAMAQSDNNFSALQGVDAQALSTHEMDAISGELNAYDIAAALTAQAAKLGSFPRVQAAVLRLAAYYTTNADAINAAFVRLGVFTPCQTCTAP